ncbi:MAG: DUF6273 domain-containing protein [Acutalibacteraceae bacterium]|nr:DUF6273 domain-containing protein [Acutalibacteraceae bacterium]
MTFKNFILKMLCILFCITLTACGNPTKQSKKIDENTILSLIPDAEEYIKQYKTKGLSVDGQADESLFRGLWHNDEYYRTEIDLSGLDSAEPFVTAKYTDKYIKNGYLVESSSDGIYNKFSYLFEPISVFLDNFSWSVNDERELIEKLMQNCVVEERKLESGSTEKRYVCSYTENHITYLLDFKNTASSVFTKSNAMNLTVKLTDVSKKYKDLQKQNSRVKKITDSLSKGDIVELGYYEQDNDKDNGKENIKWYVLKTENNKALLLSKYILDGMSYKSTEDYQAFCNGWHESDIRTWLNDIFYNETFKDDEKCYIAVSNIGYETYEATDIISSGTVEDKVFLLEKEEFPEELNIKIAFATEYASYKVRSEQGMIGASSYWYKNEYNHLGSIVTSIGNIGASTDFKYLCGVRPAIWVNFGV